MCKLKCLNRKELVNLFSSILEISRTKAKEIERRTVDGVTGKFFNSRSLRWIVSVNGDFFFVESKHINTALQRGAQKVDYRMSNKRLKNFLFRLDQSDSTIRITIPVGDPRKKQHRRRVRHLAYAG